MYLDYPTLGRDPDRIERFKYAVQSELRELYPHYHGYAVRRLFIAAAVLMLVGLSTFHDLPIFLSVSGIFVLIVVAGFTDPNKVLSVVFDAFVSLFALTVFEFYAVLTAHSLGYTLFFHANQLLALIFLFAFYYSIKTLRGLWFDKS